MKLLRYFIAVWLIAVLSIPGYAQDTAGDTAVGIVTPRPAQAPRINGAKVLGVRPGHPLLFTIPATGERPLRFSAHKLPKGIRLDRATGRLSGTLAKKGTYAFTIQVTNRYGENQRRFSIVAGDTLALTPPMGWNSWNIYAESITQELLLANARALVTSGLADHGWCYMNIDDVWQGSRGGKYHAIQPNPLTFPDMPRASREIHALGLKLGIYSSPWIETYGRHIGGSANNPDGLFTPVTTHVPHNINQVPYAIGQYHFSRQDAQQWARWQVDYLKYDWNPNEVPETQEMRDALQESGRDVVLSLSNSMPFKNIPGIYRLANSWRTGGDIVDTWQSLKPRLFTQDKWAPFAGPGHWNDPDMMVVGVVGWGKHYHATRLTPDEQYTHMSAWCLMASPLLLGCDLTKLDSFTIGLLTNDEVIEVNQDPLGRQGTIVWREGDLFIMAKDMEDGSKAVGLFNAGDKGTQELTLSLSDLHLTGKHLLRDLWRQRDMGAYEGAYTAKVRQHGVVLLRIL